MARSRRIVLNSLDSRDIKTPKRPMVEILEQEFLEERALVKALEEFIGQSAQSFCDLSTVVRKHDRNEVV